MFQRKLEVGDIINCKGVKAEIKEILFQDAYIDDFVPDDRKYIDIEFKDTKGQYRHWKSHLDGGTVMYKTPKVKESKKGVKIIDLEKYGYVCTKIRFLDLEVVKSVLEGICSEYNCKVLDKEINIYIKILGDESNYEMVGKRLIDDFAKYRSDWKYRDVKDVFVTDELKYEGIISLNDRILCDKFDIIYNGDRLVLGTPYLYDTKERDFKELYRKVLRTLGVVDVVDALKYISFTPKGDYTKVEVLCNDLETVKRFLACWDYCGKKGKELAEIFEYNVYCENNIYKIVGWL